MRKFDFYSHLKNKPDFTKRGLRLISKEKSKCLSSTKRTAVEEKFLIRLDMERWIKWQKSGKIKITGKRKYTFTV